MKTPLFVATLALTLASASVATAEPSLSHAVPGAVRPGQTIEMTLHGAKLGEPLHLWKSFAGNIEVLPELDENGKSKPIKADRSAVRCKVTADPSAPVGVAGIIAGTGEGASDALLLMVDDLPSAAEASNNHSIESAQSVAPPVAVDGASNGVSFDHFKFSAKAGQRLSFEIVAARIGSSFDPVMRLLDSSGRELAFADDDPSLGPDCRFSHTFKADGEYVIQLRDVRYRGGGAYRYRLRIGDFPLVTTPWPLGGQLGKTTAVGFVGPDVEKTASTTVVAPKSPRDRFAVSARRADGQSSAMAEIALSPLPNVVEAEPNADFPGATVVETPCAVNGRFETPADTDCYRFVAKKGQKLTFRGVSRTLGSPSYLLLQIVKADGATVAEAGAAKATESLAFSAAADGEYALVVKELLGRGGPDHAYRIEIEPVKPEFQLSVKSDKNGRRKFLADANGAVAIEVECARQGYDGPIELSVQGVEGCRLRRNVIPPKGKSANVLIDIPPSTEAGAVLPLRIVGKAVESEAQDVVSTAGLVRSQRETLLDVPVWLDGLLVAGVSSKPAAIFETTPDRETVCLAKGIGKAAFSLALTRKGKNFKGELAVYVEDVPDKIKAAVKKVGKDKDERYEVALTGQADVAEGEHSIKLVAYGESAGRVQRTVTSLPLKIVAPVSVDAAAEGPLTAGQRQKVKLSLKRQFIADADKGSSVTLRLKDLPPGVSGPGEITIRTPVEQFEFGVELSSTANAKIGKHEDIKVEAQTKFDGQDFNAVVAAFALEVKAP